MKTNVKIFRLILLNLFICFLFFSLSMAGSNKIEKASKQQVELLKILLNKDVTIKRSATIKSSTHKNAYYVGLNFIVPGVKEIQTGVWLLGGDKIHPRSILAVDGFAQNFSRATAADKTNPPTAFSYDPECVSLKNYLK